MHKVLLVIPAAASLVATSLLVTASPAKALPTCEQEVSIRCSGYSVQNRGRLDIYYDSFEECVAAETPMICPGYQGVAGVTDNVDMLKMLVRS